jgi:transposase
MSLHPDPIGEIPVETARVAHAAFPKGTVAMRLREEFDALYQDEDFQALYPNRGQPALAPWRLALVTIFQFLEHLSDRQAADAVRARIDWKFALGLELTDPGFHFSVLTGIWCINRVSAVGWGRYGGSPAAESSDAVQVQRTAPS